MDIETRLADPAYDLPVPVDGMQRVQQRALRMRRRRRAVVLLPVVGVLGISAAVLGHGGHRSTTLYGSVPTPSAAPVLTPANQQLQTFCLLPEDAPVGGMTDLIGPTGDPIDNCARFWRHALHTEPPALVAYQDIYSNVYVQARSEPLPTGARLLPPGASQNAEAIELAEALGDPIGMGPDHCRDQRAAVADARKAVRLLGFRDWPVRVDESRSDRSAALCWGSAPDLRAHVVTVIGIEGDLDFPPVLEQIAKPLRASLTQCWSRAKALSEVNAAIAASSLKTEFKDLADIREVDVPGARCTVIRLSAGGGVTITLRGPA